LSPFWTYFNIIMQNRHRGWGCVCHVIY